MSTAADHRPTAAAEQDTSARLRRGVYLVLIAVALGQLLGRIMAVDSVDLLQLEESRIKQAVKQYRARLVAEGVKGDELDEAVDDREGELRDALQLRRPFLSANDRSRWNTVRALVEPELRVPGAPYAIDKVIAQPRWDTIDMVRHPNGHFYSSKPPLLATLVAGEYWMVYRLTGMTLGTHPYEVGRFLLVTINLIPWAVYLLVLSLVVERLGTTDWGRIFVVAAGAMATLLTAFGIVLNNHLPAAVCAMLVLYALVRIWIDGDRRLRWFALAGVFAALLTTCELPALSLAALVSVALLWRAPRQTLLAYLPAAVLVAAAFFATNWVAFHSLKPPYMHRAAGDNWYDYTYERNGRVIESYWNHPAGVDRGEPSRGTYVLHSLVGHHGVFSLTPVWLLAFVGMGMWLVRPPRAEVRHLALLVAGLTAVCLVFYLLLQPQINRNYGGMSCGLRWMFWFAPLWLVAMLPAADWVSRRVWGRWLAAALLVISAMSVAYPTWNPWTHPWLFDLMWHMDWV
jgi:hypothetical protein